MNAAAAEAQDARQLHSALSTSSRLTVIPQIETVIVNLMNTDEPGPRIARNQRDALLGKVLAARLR